MATCPICKRTILANHSTVGVFCSTRCQQVDLGRWLREDYAFPSTREPEDIDDAEEESPEIDADSRS